MEFKKGDRVICIDNYLCSELIINKQYIVSYSKEHDDNPIRNRIMLENIDHFSFLHDRFILDEKYYRKEKLKQLRK